MNIEEHPLARIIHLIPQTIGPVSECVSFGYTTYNNIHQWKKDIPYSLDGYYFFNDRGEFYFVELPQDDKIVYDFLKNFFNKTHKTIKYMASTYDDNKYIISNFIHNQIIYDIFKYDFNYAILRDVYVKFIDDKGGLYLFQQKNGRTFVTEKTILNSNLIKSKYYMINVEKILDDFLLKDVVYDVSNKRFL